MIIKTYIDRAVEDGRCFPLTTYMKSEINDLRRELANLIKEVNTTWISVSDRLPDDETPVIIVYRNNVVVGERRWEHPAYYDNFASFWFWDSPTDEGQDWDRDKVTHWMSIPALPTIINYGETDD